MNLPSVSPQHPLVGSRRLLKQNVSVPYSLPLPTEDTKWKVAFEKPSDITLVGSWANKVSVKAKDHIPFGVDLAVEMPSVSLSPSPPIRRSECTSIGTLSREGLPQRPFLPKTSILSCDNSCSNYLLQRPG